MFTLKNSTLEVELLDPIADSARFGPRYCSGGYIFQVTDATHGPLLTGPTYPDSFDQFNGQGIPDAFNLAPLRAAEGDTAMLLGIGLCDLKKNVIVEPCQWQIEQGEGFAKFTTNHAFNDWSVDLVRTVRLINRTIRSETQVTNTGKRFLPISWFPHPFYPHPDTDELIKLNIPVSFGKSSGYAQVESGFIARTGWPWTGGHYQPLDHAATNPLVVIQKHPKLGQVTATCSYVPAFFPIWGNPITFSWEPFFERTVAPGQDASWAIDYDF